MRIRVSVDGLTVQAIAGTYVVLLGMNASDTLAASLLGFSIQRTDHTTNSTYWMWNDLLFAHHAAELAALKAQQQTPDPGLFGSDLNPFQEFLRGDYTVAPGGRYTYRIVAQGGSPDALLPLAEATIEVSTEPETPVKGHAVWFNRGAATSQRYASEFGNRRPDQVPDRAAYIWLSRGLEEALLAFLANAADSAWAIRGAIYEFQYPPLLDALRAAHQRGVDVSVLYDDTTSLPGSPAAHNDAAVTAARIKGITRPRSSGSTIKHNKFLVISHDEAPVAVWTGSTNWTEAGLFGHANVGHAFWDPDIARRYIDYWTQLADDPPAGPLKTWDTTTTPVPRDAAGLALPGVHAIYSPRDDDSALNWYAELIGRATNGIFLSAPFGISAAIRTVLEEHSDHLRYVLVDQENTRTVALSVRDGHPENQITGGAYIPHQLGQWLQEVTSKQLGLTHAVVYIHTKILLINPLTDDPTLLVGSANFSPNSTHSNDENMLLIRGDTRLADIYLADYMRIFNHYRFRARLKLPATALGPDPHGATTADRTLDPTPAWAQAYYKPTDPGRFQERLLFSGAATP